MRKLLLALAIIAVTGSALGGAYEDILEAAERGDTPAVINLIKRGMDVNTADQRGNSLSMIAARTGNVELIDFLLNSRAAVNRRNRFGDTAALLAAANGQIQALKLIHERGGQLEPGGWSALHYAVFGKSPELLVWVIARKPQLDARAPNGQTALMFAAKLGNLDYVKQLIEADADMDLADYDGLTALALAKRAGHMEIAGFLLESGAVE
jgi:ankyrin repeat protein